jgi:HEAT repeat protein
VRRIATIPSPEANRGRGEMERVMSPVDHLEPADVMDGLSRARRWSSRSLAARLMLSVGLPLASISVLAGLLIGGIWASIWIENRFPSDDSARALFPQMQRLVTRPVVNAVGGVLARRVRTKLESAFLHSGLTEQQSIARFLDGRVEMSERRLLAYRLARADSSKSLAALVEVFQSAPAVDKAFMAQLLGTSGMGAVKPLLLPLVDSKDDGVAIAAIRGLCALGGEDVESIAAAVIRDARRSDALRAAAAGGLGALGTSRSLEALTSALRAPSSEPIETALLESLGKFDFPRVSSLFGDYIADPRRTSEQRAAAVEALQDSSTESIPFLLDLARRNPEAEVRASAAWTISTHNEIHDLAPVLVALALAEKDPDVRRRLYEAMWPQTEIPAERLLPLVEAERDIAARVAGCNALGAAAFQQPHSETARVFDDRIVPELRRIATSPNSLNIQMRSVFALRRAKSEKAREALVEIAHNARPQIATAAKNGLGVR